MAALQVHAGQVYGTLRNPHPSGGGGGAAGEEAVREAAASGVRVPLFTLHFQGNAKQCVPAFLDALRSTSAHRPPHKLA